MVDPGTERLTLVSLFASLLRSRCSPALCPLQVVVVAEAWSGGGGQGQGEDFDEEPKETSVTPQDLTQFA